MQVSFHLARILFALSALPFVLFEVPGLQTLLSHTHATGYNWRGECDQHGQRGRLGGAIAGYQGLIRLQLKA